MTSDGIRGADSRYGVMDPSTAGSRGYKRVCHSSLHPVYIRKWHRAIRAGYIRHRWAWRPAGPVGTVACRRPRTRLQDRSTAWVGRRPLPSALAASGAAHATGALPRSQGGGVEALRREAKRRSRTSRSDHRSAARQHGHFYSGCITFTSDWSRCATDLGSRTLEYGHYGPLGNRCATVACRHWC